MISLKNKKQNSIQIAIKLTLDGMHMGESYFHKNIHLNGIGPINNKQYWIIYNESTQSETRIDDIQTALSEFLKLVWNHNQTPK